MVSWSQLREYVYSNYKVKGEEGNVLELLFDLGNGRSQLVYISYQTLMDGAEGWLHVESPFGTLDRIDLQRAVRAVGGMVCGSIASVADRFVTLRHSVPLENLDLNEFERPLRLVTTSADELESMLSVGDVF
jgi:hypothetical protein